MDANTTPMGASAVGYTESINQPTKIRLADGSEVAITDWSWMMLYSTVDILTGATDEEFYTFNYVEANPVSHSSNIGANQTRNATKKDCNNNGKGQMPSEEEFLCYSIAIDAWQFGYNPAGLQEAAYLSAQSGGVMINGGNLSVATTKLIWALEVTEKDFFTGNLGWFGSGGGPFVGASSGGGAGALRTYGTNGVPSKDVIDRSPVPVHIGGTEEFRMIAYNSDGLAVNWQGEDGVTVANMVVRFHTKMIGLRKRGAA